LHIFHSEIIQFPFLNHYLKVVLIQSFQSNNEYLNPQSLTLLTNSLFAQFILNLILIFLLELDSNQNIHLVVNEVLYHLFLFIRANISQE